VRTALAMTVMRFGLMRDLRKICQDFSRAMPRSTGARAAARAPHGAPARGPGSATPEVRRLTAVDGAQGRYEPEGQRITVAAWPTRDWTPPGTPWRSTWSGTWATWTPRNGRSGSPGPTPASLAPAACGRAPWTGSCGGGRRNRTPVTAWPGPSRRCQRRLVDEPLPFLGAGRSVPGFDLPCPVLRVSPLAAAQEHRVEAGGGGGRGPHRRRQRSSAPFERVKVLVSAQSPDPGACPAQATPPARPWGARSCARTSSRRPLLWPAR
jgi:hypothetical protein